MNSYAQWYQQALSSGGMQWAVPGLQQQAAMMDPNQLYKMWSQAASAMGSQYGAMMHGAQQHHSPAAGSSAARPPRAKAKSAERHRTPDKGSGASPTAAAGAGVKGQRMPRTAEQADKPARSHRRPPPPPVAADQDPRQVDYVPYSIRDYKERFDTGGEYWEVGKLGPEYDPAIDEKRCVRRRGGEVVGLSLCEGGGAIVPGPAAASARPVFSRAKRQDAAPPGSGAATVGRAVLASAGRTGPIATGRALSRWPLEPRGQRAPAPWGTRWTSILPSVPPLPGSQGAAAAHEGVRQAGPGAGQGLGATRGDGPVSGLQQHPAQGARLCQERPQAADGRAAAGLSDAGGITLLILFLWRALQAKRDEDSQEASGQRSVSASHRPGNGGGFAFGMEEDPERLIEMLEARRDEHMDRVAQIRSTLAVEDPLARQYDEGAAAAPAPYDM